MKVRRVVTGQNDDGKSVYVSDEEVDPITLALLPGFEFHRLWGSDAPPSLPTGGESPAAPAYFPPAGGYRFGFFTVPPDSGATGVAPTTSTSRPPSSRWRRSCPAWPPTWSRTTRACTRPTRSTSRWCCRVGSSASWTTAPKSRSSKVTRSFRTGRGTVGATRVTSLRFCSSRFSVRSGAGSFADVLATDVLVVGGGPAGAAAATTLARAGRDVVVIDKARFPRDKCCGDGLTAEALRLLEATRPRSSCSYLRGRRSTVCQCDRPGRLHDHLSTAPRRLVASRPWSAGSTSTPRCSTWLGRPARRCSTATRCRARRSSTTGSWPTSTVSVLSTRGTRSVRTGSGRRCARHSARRDPATSASGMRSASTSTTSDRRRAGSGCGSSRICCPATHGRSRCPTGEPTWDSASSDPRCAGRAASTACRR